MVDVSTQTMPSFEALPQKETDAIDFDPAIVSVGRCEYSQMPHSSNDQSDDPLHILKCSRPSYADNEQRINVVEQMIVQARVPFSLLPKHFKPKQVSKARIQQQSYPADNEFRPPQSADRLRTEADSNPYSNMNQWYRPYTSQQEQYPSQISMQILPSYEIYPSKRKRIEHRRNGNHCIRDDHRINTVIPQSWKDEQTRHKLNGIYV